jgi:hypothetical protein
MRIGDRLPATIPGERRRHPRLGWAPRRGRRFSSVGIIDRLI